MTLKTIDPRKLSVMPHELFNFQTLLLTSGDYASGQFNMMTIGWGALGTMWNKPMAMVVVRPTRYTYEFMEAYPDFTLTAFPAAYRRALGLLGTKSGRDIDKVAESKLSPIAAKQVKSPSFAEAELSIECVKTYFDDFEPEHFLSPRIMDSYPERDFHRIYFGEIVHVEGTERFEA